MDETEERIYRYPTNEQASKFEHEDAIVAGKQAFRCNRNWRRD
jgi:hypothetical protein